MTMADPTPLLHPHEAGFLAFVPEPARRRIGALLDAGAKRRQQVRALLDHGVRLDPRFAELLTGRAHMHGAIVDRLRRHGAPEQVTILSACATLDGVGILRSVLCGSGSFC